MRNPEDGSCIREEQTDRRFFEGAWVHKRKGVYYLSYSTGDTHLIAAHSVYEGGKEKAVSAPRQADRW